ncbi:MAG: AMP-binding protein [Archangium sp.]|nr:AMP-binding protein [Archangium sp.]MDP3573370.1 AMP-binding protein [Archangium sp.]
MNRECPVALAARARPDSVALIFQGRTYTWAEADREVAAFTDSLDVAAGDRVAVRAWNCPELAWLFFAASRRGAVFVPLNARLTSHELAPLLERLDARVSFGDLPGALSLSLRERLGVRASVASEVAAALFTSGTTGAAKLVELTHANFTASARANAERLGGEPTQRWLGTLPLFHVGGLAMLYRCALYGASIALEASFDAERACAAMDEGVTHVSLVPTMLERVLEVRGARPFTGVKAALIGGGPMTSSTLRRARAAGLPVLQTYGLTEACSQVTTEVPEEADGLTAGRPIPGVEVRITEPDEGGVGEIEVRGPTVAKGLGPWLKTKDLGSLDARGRLSVRSRRMDLILTGGENVYPAEVEAVLREYPGIRDVAVVARPDSEWGQVPVAVVVASEFEAAAVTAWVRERLAAYKIPRAWVLVDVLPRNATGKLDRLGLLKLI